MAWDYYDNGFVYAWKDRNNNTLFTFEHHPDSSQRCMTNEELRTSSKPGRVITNYAGNAWEYTEDCLCWMTEGKEILTTPKRTEALIVPVSEKFVTYFSVNASVYEDYDEVYAGYVYGDSEGTHDIRITSPGDKKINIGASPSKKIDFIYVGARCKYETYGGGRISFYISSIGVWFGTPSKVYGKTNSSAIVNFAEDPGNPRHSQSDIHVMDGYGAVHNLLAGGLDSGFYYRCRDMNINICRYP